MTVSIATPSIITPGTSGALFNLVTGQLKVSVLSVSGLNGVTITEKGLFVQFSSVPFSSDPTPEVELIRHSFVSGTPQTYIPFNDSGIYTGLFKQDDIQNLLWAKPHVTALADDTFYFIRCRYLIKTSDGLEATSAWSSGTTKIKTPSFIGAPTFAAPATTSPTVVDDSAVYSVTANMPYPLMACTELKNTFEWAKNSTFSSGLKGTDTSGGVGPDDVIFTLNTLNNSFNVDGSINKNFSAMLNDWRHSSSIREELSRDTTYYARVRQKLTYKKMVIVDGVATAVDTVKVSANSTTRSFKTNPFISMAIIAAPLEANSDSGITCSRTNFSLTLNGCTIGTGFEFVRLEIQASLTPNFASIAWQQQYAGSAYSGQSPINLGGTQFAVGSKYFFRARYVIKKTGVATLYYGTYCVPHVVGSAPYNVTFTA